MADQPQQSDARNLLQLATDISLDLGKLATGLAHAGANPQAVAGLHHMAVMIGDMAKTLGAGPAGAQGQAAPGGPEAGAPAPGGPPEGGPGGSPAEAPAAAGPPQGARPGERPNGLHEPTMQLAAALAHAKAAKASQAAAQAAAR